MVVNIAFYETVFFILSLLRTRDFTPASCKSYLTPRNQCPVPHNQCPAPRKQQLAPRKQPAPRILEKLGSATLYGKNILSYVHRLPCRATMCGISLIEIVGWY